MGKIKNAKAGGDSQHSPSTIFVANLPYSFSNSQMEELFSEVGPIRRCFLVTKKGSTEHRGFGYVQFASVEDAYRAIEQKNHVTVGGRKITVKQAMVRAPLEKRRANADKGPSEDFLVEKPNITKKADKDDKISVAQSTDDASENTEKAAVSTGIPDQQKVPEKQRAAKTVIIGGILNDGMAEEVHHRAGDFGSICSISYPLSEQQLEHHGLAVDGCKPAASSILYTSVKSARQCVSALHQKEIHGCFVWARQLGGEGAKTQKWKLIVRNLPFKVKAAEIRDMFSSVAFVWDVAIAQNPETGLSKGYAFIKLTSRQDAEKAIQNFNGKIIGKRPIAVDWAVPKKIYVIGSHGAAAEDGPGKVDASYSESEDDDIEAVKQSQIVDENNDSMDEAGQFDGNDTTAEIDLVKEQEIAKKVLHNFILPPSKDAIEKGSKTPSAVQVSDDLRSAEIELDDTSATRQVAPKETRGRQKDANATQSEDELRRTVFINNLPFDVNVEEVKKRFSAFGEVQSFLPVLHKVTKRPRGSGFLKFTSPEATNAAFSAASDETGSGILIKGRKIKVLKALDKKAATDKSLEKAKKVENDHRNLYLAKEGLILEGTPAGESVSASDMTKRTRLHEDKMSKLRSPNFRVSNTRLIVYNVPKTMDERGLKSLFINAVTSRATKQKPIIRQIKIMKDSKDGTKTRKRAVAFLEFSEHQHALVALRVLNNNPDTFDPEYRPIVEFALDNVQKLKLRKEKLQLQQQRDSDGSSFPDSSSRKKRELGSADDEGTAVEEGVHQRKKRKAFKKGEARDLSSETNMERLTPETGIEKKKKKEFQVAKRDKSSSIKTKASSHSETTQMAERRKPSVASANVSRGSDEALRKRKRSKKDPIGRDIVDELDRLVAQYRAKFSGSNTWQKDDQNQQGIKRLKRWFE